MLDRDDFPQAPNGKFLGSGCVRDGVPCLCWVAEFKKAPLTQKALNFVCYASQISFDN